MAIVTQITCNGLTNGSIDLTPSGGVAPYSNFVWSNGATTQDLANVRMNYRVWSEFLPYEEAADAHVLRLLSRWKVAPHIAVKHDADLDGLANVLQAAASHGVQVWLWPLLSHHDGYWANDWNIDLAVFSDA